MKAPQSPKDNNKVIVTMRLIEKAARVDKSQPARNGFHVTFIERDPLEVETGISK
jgi:hypothetical protein